ncbi:hypothetical protein EOA30_05725 [Mesorhizobium sp. M8A.F.Ca.ET.059.01.1.1]|nr:hypothetical protein EOA30_05725 [Mesorhizobium sp. M8A.F.Ca.ET.059.01.1.1]
MKVQTGAGAGGGSGGARSAAIAGAPTSTAAIPAKAGTRARMIPISKSPLKSVFYFLSDANVLRRSDNIYVFARLS